LFIKLYFLGSAIWEREPNRRLTILTDYNLVMDQNGFAEELNKVGREIELITNSHIDKLDVNFVSHLKFDKIGDYNIYIGPYPQNEDDIGKMAQAGITAVLNVQTDMDMVHRQVNWEHNLAAYKKHKIQVVRYPIRDFDQDDLIKKLKGANDTLKELLMEKKTVYVHCTAGMSRAAATVIGYLVFYECYSLEDAYEFVKSHRSIICPNMGALAEVIKNYS
jgi:protein-tyrosine phosphatase